MLCRIFVYFKGCTTSYDAAQGLQNPRESSVQIPHDETCKHYIANHGPSSANTSINKFLDITVQAAIDKAKVNLK